jgi:hypothetical protein
LVPVAVIALGLLLYIYFHPGVRNVRAAGPTEPEEAQGADVVELAPRRESRGGG